MKYIILSILLIEIIFGVKNLVKFKDDTLIKISSLVFIFYIIGVLSFFFRLPNSIVIQFVCSVLWIALVMYNCFWAEKNDFLLLITGLIISPIIYLRYAFFGFNHIIIISLIVGIFILIKTILKKKTAILPFYVLLLIDFLRILLDKIW
jgi:hypothetical protein